MSRTFGPPPWWDWELELSLHVERRMVDRDFTEVELRAMLEQSTDVAPALVEGRFVARTRHRGAPWEVILEPDEETHTVVVVTAYAKT